MFLAQTVNYSYDVDTTGGSFYMSGWAVFLWLAIVILMIIGMWKLFTKAGEEGWKSIIPFYNTYTLFRIAGRNGWGFLLMLIPFVNLIVMIVISLDLAKHFGKSTLFAIFGLILFPFVGYLMLGYGSAEYVGEKHQ